MSDLSITAKLHRIEELVFEAGKITKQASWIWASDPSISVRRFEDACDRGMARFYSKTKGLKL